MKVLVTGANGFVGSRLCPALAESGFQVRAVSGPGPGAAFPAAVETAAIGDIGPATDWSPVLQGVDAIIHLAARVHVMRESARDPLAEFRRVNTEGTRNLALKAAKAGIARIVYLSTIKVNGEQSGGAPFNEASLMAPQDAYAVSKAEAEKALQAICAPPGIQPVIIRAPLVYGPGVKGNLLKLMQAIKRGLPLPLGNIRNKRSLISLDNLVDVLILAATRAEALGQTFAVSDGEDLSTTDLANGIAAALGKKGRLFALPRGSFPLAARWAPSLKPAIERLTGSLIIDSSKFRKTMGWAPAQTVSQGIDMMAADFLRKAGHAG